MWAPISVSIEARSAISGSRAAFSITVVPLASTAPIKMLSVAVWLGNWSTIACADQAVAVPVDVAVLGDEGGAELLERAQVEVDRAVAEVVASGHRDPGGAVAGEQRAEHDDRGPHLLDELVGGDGRHVVRDGDLEVASRAVGPRGRTSAPIARRTSDMIATSLMTGTLSRRCTPGASRHAAMSFSTEFFAPFTCTLPCSGPDGRDDEAIHGETVLPRSRRAADSLQPERADRATRQPRAYASPPAIVGCRERPASGT